MKRSTQQGPGPVPSSQVSLKACHPGCLCPQEALNQARLLQCTGTVDCELITGKSLSLAVIHYVAVDKECTRFLIHCWSPTSDDVWPKLTAH